MKHLIITPETCLGDKWHNEAIRTIDAASGKYAAKTKRAIAGLIDQKIARHNEKLASLGCETRPIQWCGIEKQEAKRFFALANSKSAKTFEKRREAVCKWLIDKEHYGALFNRDYIETIKSL